MKSCNDCINRSLSCLREHNPDFADHCSKYLEGLAIPSTITEIGVPCRICGKSCDYVGDSFVICKECTRRLRKLLYPEEV